MKIIKMKEQKNNPTIDKLTEEVRNAACKSTEALWGAFLEVGELDMVRATEKALRLMVSHGDHTGAMKVLEGVYALAEVAPSRTSPTASGTPPWRRCSWRNFWQRAGTSSLTWAWMMCWNCL